MRYNELIEKQSKKDDEKSILKLPDLEVGDEIFVGKFKNKKAKITGFSTDKNGHPVLKTTAGEKQVFKPRFKKLLPDQK